MAPLTSLPPSIQDCVQHLMAHTYPAKSCWRYVLDLMHAGGFGDWRETPGEAIAATREVWFCGDHGDPLSLAHPWDWLLLARRGRPERGAPIGHIGVVMDATTFTHVRVTGGVWNEPIARWRSRLVQVARLRGMDEGGRC